MKKIQWKTVIFWVLVAEAVGILAGILSREGIAWYNSAAIQPPFSPPPLVFPVVWGILYALMGVGAGLVAAAPASKERSRGLNLMVAQLTINFFWPLLFFNVRAFGFALLWLILLWILLLRMTLSFRKTFQPAAWLQIPYLLWLTFALYLNAGVWYLN